MSTINCAAPKLISNEEGGVKDAISSIVIARVETVAEDDSETQTSLQLQTSESPKRARISFNCDICTFCTTTRFSLARHLENHKQGCSIPATSHAKQCPAGDAADLEPTKPPGGTSPHRPTNQVKMKIFKCSHCSFSSKFHFIMKKHLLTHLNRPTNYKCRYCPFEAKSIRVLLPHLVNKHRNYNETCPRCRKLVSLQLKNEHLQICKARNPTLQCSLCPYKTFKRKQLAAHERNCPKLPKKVTNCDFCSFSTKCERSLREHTLLHTKLNRPIYDCPHCDFKSTKRNFENHMKSQHREQKSESPEESKPKPFKCSQCAFTAVEAYIFNRHSLTHRHLPRDFKCRLCAFKGISYKSLQTHIGVTHKKAGLKCLRCLQKVPTHELAEHNLTCNAPDPRATEIKIEKVKDEYDDESSSQANSFECDFCQSSFPKLDVLERHLQCHDEQLFKCPICEYRAPKQSLTKHFEDVHLQQLSAECIKKPIKQEPTNADKKQWSCEFCSFSSSYSFTMKQHRLHHTELNKPIVRCNHCAYKSLKKIVEKHSMDVHQIPYNYPQGKSGTAIKPDPDQDTRQIQYVCENCDYSTSSREVLIQHKLSLCSKKTCNSGKSETCNSCQRSFAANHVHKCRPGTNRYRVTNECGSRMFYCNCCEYKTMGRRNINRHWTKNHQSMEFDGGDHFLFNQSATFKCETCDFQTNLEDSLQNHQVLHINIKKVKVYKSDTYNVEMANENAEISEDGSD